MDKGDAVCVCVCVCIYICMQKGILFSHKKNEILPFAAMWMDLQIIILIEISQREKNKYHMIPVILESKK